MFQNIFNWFIILIGFLGLILIIVNYLLVESPKMDENNLNDSQKKNPFECGFDSFRQSNNPVPIPFIVIALLFLPFDLEVSSMLPYILSQYTTDQYGLILFVLFLSILIIGFIVELNEKALGLDKLLTNFNKIKEFSDYIFIKDNKK